MSALERLVTSAMAAGFTCIAEEIRDGRRLYGETPSPSLVDILGDFPAQFLEIRPSLVDDLRAEWGVPELAAEVERLRAVTDIIDPDSVYREQRDAAIAERNQLRDAAAETLVAHRPYGLDCKCGRPINSDADWAGHVAQVLGGEGEGGPKHELMPDGRGAGMRVCRNCGRTEPLDTERCEQ